MVDIREGESIYFTLPTYTHTQKDFLKQKYRARYFNLGVVLLMVIVAVVVRWLCFSPQHFVVVQSTITGVQSNQDLIWCVKKGFIWVLGSIVGSDYFDTP